MDENKVIPAKDIVDNPDIIHTFHNAYIMINDQSITGRYTNLIVATNILFEYGWDVVNMVYDGTNMYIFCRNRHAKRKNDALNPTHPA